MSIKQGTPRSSMSACGLRRRGGFGIVARFFAGLAIAALSVAMPPARAVIWYGDIVGMGGTSCVAGVYTVPAGANFVEVTAIGQGGQDGTAYSFNDYAYGVGGLGGIVKVVVAVTPGQKLWAAPTSSMFQIWGVSGGGGSGGYGSFVATADPNPGCPFGKPDKSSLLVVAGGGGGGASGSPRGTGGSGANAGPNGGTGGNGGNNGQQDGGGGGGGTQTAGGFGGAGGHGNLFSPDAPQASGGGYFGGGAPGSASRGADAPSQPGGGGGGGYYGGGGGGGDAGGGGGGGGAGSNYIMSSIPNDAPLYNRPAGTWINGSTADGAKVQIVPIFTTTTTISSSPNPSALGQQVTITASVASSGGGAPPGGDVKFYDGTTFLGTVASSGGNATLQISTLTSGTHYLQAIYQGDGSDSGGIHFASATHGTNVGGVILPYQHVVGAAPPTPVAPAVTLQPFSQSGQYGGSTIYFNAEASGTPTPSIQWQVSSDNGVSFSNTSGSGGFSANYLAITPAMALSGYKYRAVFTNSAGSATTNVVALTVSPWNLWIIANDKSVDYLGQIPALDVHYGDGSSGTSFVQGDTPGSLIGTLTCTTTATASSLPGTYPITCSGVSSPNYTITFKPGTLTVNAPTQKIVVDGGIPQTPLPGSPGRLTFKSVDLGTTYDITAYGGNSGQPITFAVSPSLGPAPTFTCTDSSGGCTDVVEGTSTPVCTLTTTGIGKARVSFNAVLKQFRLGRCYVNLNQAGATINGAVYPAAQQVQLDFQINYGAPGITTQPADQSVAAGQTATFTIAANGAPPPTLQWQVSVDNGATFNNVAGATSPTLTVTNVLPTQNGNRYRVLVTNNPNQNLVYRNTDLVSNVATLTVSIPPGVPFVSLDPADTTTLDSNPVTFTAIGGGNPVPTSAKWQVSTDGGATFSDVVPDPFTIVGVTTNAGSVTTTLHLSIPAYNVNGNLYRAVFINTNGSATSAAAKLTVQDRILIINNGKPADQSVAIGQTASFGLDYIAEPAPTFQWQTKVGGVWTNIPGATARTLTIANVASSANGSQYQVMLTQGSPFYASATSRTATLTVIGASPSLATPTLSNAMFGVAIGDGATLAGGYNPTGTLTFALFGAGDAACSAAPVFTSSVAVSGNGVYVSSSFTPASVGTYQWSITYSGDANNNAASVVCGTSGQSVSVAQANQSIAFGAAPSVNVGGSGTVTATGGASGNPVTFGTSSAASICTVSSTGSVAGIGVGACIVTADQAGNANYATAPQATQTVTIGQGSQSIAFGAAPSVNVGGSGTVSATGGASGNPVTFGTSSSASICTVSVAGNVIGVGVGACVVTANQAGNANYTAAAQTTQTVTIGQGSQVITFGIAPSITVGGTGMVTATGGASGNSVTFGTTSSASICTVSATGSVVGIGAGACMVTADQAGDANYSAAPSAALILNIGQSLSSLALNADKASAVFGETVTLTATIDSGNPTPGGHVDFSSDGAPLCANVTVAAGKAMCATASLAVGDHTIRADYSGDANTISSNSALTQKVVKAQTTLTVSANPSPLVWTQSVAVSVSILAASPGNGTPTGSVVVDDGAETCTIVLPATSCSLTPSAYGNLTVTASYAGDDNFDAATQSETLSVETAHMSAMLACTPVQATAGMTVSCQATCTNTGPAVALNAQCSLTTSSSASSSLGADRSTDAIAIESNANAAAPACTPIVPVAVLAARASIVCTMSFVNAGTTVSVRASAVNAVAGADSTSAISFSASGPAVPAPALRPLALTALMLCVAWLAFVSLRRRMRTG